MAESTPPALPTVAVINGLQDTLDMLRIVLEGAGLQVVEAQARDVRRGVVDLVAFVRQHDVRVVLFDIAIPYEENWQAVQACRADPRLSATPFVVTTTNKRALDSIVGPSDTVEIIGKPYDLRIVVDAVTRAMAKVRNAGQP